MGLYSQSQSTTATTENEEAEEDIHRQKKAKSLITTVFYFCIVQYFASTVLGVSECTKCTVPVQQRTTPVAHSTSSRLFIPSLPIKPWAAPSVGIQGLFCSTFRISS